MSAAVDPTPIDIAAVTRRWNEGIALEAWEIAAYFGFKTRAVQQLMHSIEPKARRGRIRLYTPDQVREVLGQSKASPAAGGG